MNISEKFDVWPERAIIPIRLHLYNSTSRERCELSKLKRVFELASEYGVQEEISTNLNRLNAVYVMLNNYVLRYRNTKYATPGGWGDHWGFLLALIKAFPEDIYVDPPTGTSDYSKGLRFSLAANGAIAKEIKTCDDMA